ncbi:MAG: response regulator [Betaproteobacteria bacterium]|nr:response regulator [Betaproteobacteria bacterium]
MDERLNLLKAKLLVVDDDESIARLLGVVLRAAGYNDVTLCHEPAKVPALYRKHRYDLILLDLHMPDMDGYQVMAALKEIETEGYLPVLVITADPEEKLKALQEGAKDFIPKPFDNAEVLTRVQNLLEVRLLYREVRDYNRHLAQKVQERTARLTRSYHETLRAMTRAAEYRDDSTGAHVRRISFYARALAERLGMDGEFIDRIFHASPMHDIGKIGIPDAILLKKGPLTEAEWRIMRTHPTIGAQMLMHSESPYLQMGAQIAAAHHERWDGTGYPSGLKGGEIPLAARVMMICDVYDALRSVRPYKPAIEHQASLEIIIEGDERIKPWHFDPAVFDAFRRSAEVFREIFAANADRPEGE